MMKNKIIVPTDFTDAANQAIAQAIVISRKAGSTLTLFHVISSRDELADAGTKLNTKADSIRHNEGISCDVLIREGNLFDAIPQAVCEKDYDLMLIGTHGLQGIRQRVFGADILKLISRIQIPVMVVQEASPLVEISARSFSR